MARFSKYILPFVRLFRLCPRLHPYFTDHLISHFVRREEKIIEMLVWMLFVCIFIFLILICYNSQRFVLHINCMVFLTYIESVCAQNIFNVSRSVLLFSSFHYSTRKKNNSEKPNGKMNRRVIFQNRSRMKIEHRPRVHRSILSSFFKTHKIL